MYESRKYFPQDGDSEARISINQETNYQSQEHVHQTNLNQNPIQEQDFRNNLLTLQSNLTYSIRFNLIKLLISLAKVITSIIVISKTAECIEPKNRWLIIMLGHDLCYCLLILSTIRLVKKTNLEFDSSFEPNQGNNTINQVNNRDRNAKSNILYQGLIANYGQSYGCGTGFPVSQNLDNVRKIRRRQKVIDWAASALEICYFVIFLYGQILFALDKNDSCDPNGIINGTLLAYLILGYTWVLLPVPLMILLCLCFPVFLVVVRLLGREDQFFVTNTKINKLPVIQFSRDLPGSHECVICMNEYNVRDKIIQLNCSSTHHFHEECIKRWFGISRQCPICRMRLEDMENELEVLV